MKFHLICLFLLLTSIKAHASASCSKLLASQGQSLNQLLDEALNTYQKRIFSIRFALLSQWNIFIPESGVEFTARQKSLMNTLHHPSLEQHLRALLMVQRLDQSSFIEGYTQEHIQESLYVQLATLKTEALKLIPKIEALLVHTHPNLKPDQSYIESWINKIFEDQS